MTKRINIFLIILILLYLAIGFKLFNLQIVRSKELTARAVRQSEDTVEVLPLRGSIYDRNDNLLAYSVRTFKLSTDIYTMKDYLIDSLSKALSSITKINAFKFYKLIKDNQEKEIQLLKKVYIEEESKLIKLTKIGFKVEKNYNSDDEKNEFSIFLNFQEQKIKFYKDVAKNIAQYTKTNYEKYNNDFINSKSRIVNLEKKLNQEVKDSISALGIVGIIFEEKSKRNYQFGSLASHLLGIVSNDNQGITGTELQFNNILKGKKGYNRVIKNANGQIVTTLKNGTHPPEDGGKIYLTIDLNYQKVLEEELSKGVQQNGAKSGLGIIMNPQTGEILAYANYPYFDPNSIKEIDVDLMLDRIASDHFDPGSTFKSFTLATALETKSVTLEDKFFAENGKYNLGKETIFDSHPYQYLTVRDALIHSSNIVFAKISQKIGQNQFYKYISNFGFGNSTGIEIPFEKKGRLIGVNERNKINTSYVAHGYSISVTPLQLITAYAALINGGYLLKPHVLKKSCDFENGTEYTTNKEIIRQVISEETSRDLRYVLRDVVEKGTAKRANLTVINCGGKTGTAEKHTEKGYSSDQFFASFIGFHPIDNPNFLCLIVIDSPTGNHQGGVISAPIFRNIVERLFFAEQEAKFTLAKSVIKYDNIAEFKVPYLIGKSKDDVIKIAEELGIITSFEGEGAYVISQNYNDINKELSITLGDKIANKKMTKVPDLTGLSLKDAITTLKLHRLNFNINGSGYVISQSLKPGEMIDCGSTCNIKLGDLIQ